VAKATILGALYENVSSSPKAFFHSPVLSLVLFSVRSPTSSAANFHQAGIDIDDLDVDHLNSGSKMKYRWYVIRTSKGLPQTWNLFINFLTIYALFVTPFV